MIKCGKNEKRGKILKQNFLY